MGWFVALFLGICTLALLDDVHTKWHKRQMTQPKHFKETIYA